MHDPRTPSLPRPRRVSATLAATGLAVLLACAAPIAPAAAQEPAAETVFFLDLSSGARQTNVEVECTRADPNGQDPRSLVLATPGQSSIELRFALPVVPRRAALELEHLSSGAEVKHGGNSRISLEINGNSFVQEWEVGAHDFAVDRLDVTKLLRAGPNSLRLRFVAGETCYWLRRMAVRCTFPAGIDPAGKVECRPGRGSYAVVVSRRTAQDPDWSQVVEALRAQHEAAVIVFPAGVRAVRDALAQVFPRYVCFVAQPDEAGRDFVVAVHRLMRALDDDPYTDAPWGILTGYDAADALRIARHRAPLTVRRAAGGCGINLDAFVEGAWYSEGTRGEMWEKAAGGAAAKKACPDDTTATLVAELNDRAPDIFLTSGHATFRDWQIGYSYRNGQFRCEHGTLFGLDLAGKRYDVRSPNPKVYSPHGNCLMGQIADRESMALAWMHSAGVYQMFGYVVSTWFGYGGFGVLNYFVNLRGQHTFAESFYLNHQSLLARLESEYPRAARVDFDEWGIESDPGLLDRLAQRHLLTAREELGLLWDRDTVAFYGDPAWEARVERVADPPYEQTLAEADGRFTFTVEVRADGGWERPPAALLPYRVREVQVVEGGDLHPVITDNFILVPRTGPCKKGEAFRVVFTGKRIP